MWWNMNTQHHFRPILGNFILSQQNFVNNILSLSIIVWAVQIMHTFYLLQMVLV